MNAAGIIEQIVYSSYRSVIAAIVFGLILVATGIGLDTAGYHISAGLSVALAVLIIAVSFAGFGILWALGKVGY